MVSDFQKSLLDLQSFHCMMIMYIHYITILIRNPEHPYGSFTIAHGNLYITLHCPLIHDLDLLRTAWSNATREWLRIPVRKKWRNQYREREECPLSSGIRTYLFDRGTLGNSTAGVYSCPASSSGKRTSKQLRTEAATMKIVFSASFAPGHALYSQRSEQR
jgi:hypothetical protein